MFLRKSSTKYTIIESCENKELETDEMNELYDLKNDPDEEFNLYKNPASKQQLETMKTELQNKV